MDDLQYKKILHTLLQVMDEGVYIVDPEGVSIFYNKAMERMEQVKPGDVIGLAYTDCFPDMDIQESTIYRVIRSKTPIYNKFQSYIGPTGKNISTLNSTVPVLDDDGSLIAAVEVAHDITQLTALSEKIMQLQEIVTPSKKAKVKGIRHYHFSDLIGKDPVFCKCVDRARKAAMYDVPVFIYGETGTGKELFAQSIHYSGNRSGKPFLAQNCAALPENLLEGILFGTTKGGFTGAVDRAGLFEQAHGGTLFLDELNSMPYELQGKLLRVLQESYIRRVGGANDIPVDVRIIATVNEDPLKLISKGVLRQDLFYRLSVVNITIPPLRDRRSDIPYLAETMIEKHSEKMGKKVLPLSHAATCLLMEYDYPGNVRELENIIIQALFMADNETCLTPDLINIPRPVKKRQEFDAGYQAGESLVDYIENIEKEIILNVFDDCNGNITQCAAALHMKRQTLQYKLKKYEIVY